MEEKAAGWLPDGCRAGPPSPPPGRRGGTLALRNEGQWGETGERGTRAAVKHGPVHDAAGGILEGPGQGRSEFLQREGGPPSVINQAAG